MEGKLGRMIPKVPKGWRRVPLGEVADIAFSGVDKKTVEGEVPVRLCNYTDVFYNRRILSVFDFMQASATTAEVERWQLRKGDVLFTKDSETASEIGIPSYVAEEMSDILCGYHLGRARGQPGQVDGLFLAYAFASNRVAREFSRVANGITRFGLTLGSVRSVPVFLPPLPEQRAIAAVLNSIDEVIERTEVLIAATERLRESLRHELLTRGIPGWHSEYKEVPRFGSIPAAWEVVRLGDVAGVNQGGTPRKRATEYWDGDIPFVTAADLTEIDINRKNARTFLTKRGLYSGETVVCETGMLLLATRTRVGLAGIAEERMGASQDITRLLPHEPLNERFLCRFLFQNAGFLQRQARGTTIQGITKSDVLSTPLLLPTLAEQRTIARLLDSVDNTVDQLRRERDAIAEVKKSVAEVLLTGRVRVGEGISA